ncbi:MAG: SDR family oxidoreductase [Microscillaceae bacterium]|jgi:NAD(P)-dependent dehydrogenase (short-subunit alcohol dehydrogenase family)|nr:SDR family oxidoreductase [Microscillaceae bacterium]
MSESKVVLITGSNTGFGRLTAETLALAGHQVFASMRQINGKNAAAAQSMRDWASEKQVKLSLVECDVVNEESCQNAAAEVLAQAGRIDVLVNNAGFGVSGIQECFTVEQAQQIFDVNVFGVMRMNRAVLPAMRTQKSGLIINISSGLGRVVMPFVGIYNASKFALEALAEGLNYELRSFGIDVVVIEPGAYPTDFSHNTLKAADEARLGEYGTMAQMPEQMFAAMQMMIKNNPANPQDIADAVKSYLDMPAGQRPMRVVSSPDGGKGIMMINETCAQVQSKLLKFFGM